MMTRDEREQELLHLLKTIDGTRELKSSAMKCCEIVQSFDRYRVGTQSKEIWNRKTPPTKTKAARKPKKRPAGCSLLENGKDRLMKEDALAVASFDK